MVFIFYMYLYRQQRLSPRNGIKLCDEQIPDSRTVTRARHSFRSRHSKPVEAARRGNSKKGLNNKDRYTICNAAHLCHGLGLEAFQAVDVVGHAVGRALERGDDEQVLQVGVAAERAVLHTHTDKMTLMTAHGNVVYSSQDWHLQQSGNA